MKALKEDGCYGKRTADSKVEVVKHVAGRRRRWFMYDAMA